MEPITKTGPPANASSVGEWRAGPRDVFLNLLAMGTLYFSAIQFGVLLFQYINRYFPDVLEARAYWHTPGAGPLRWAVATLVIVFPVYIAVSYYLAREIETNPEKRGLRSRKWFIHFTLFAAAIVIIGDLVSLVYNFLSGELTPRFILKTLAVFLIAAFVFTYYLWNLKMERRALADSRMRIFVLAVIGFVAVATIGGFLIAGSPFRERLRRFDVERVQNLNDIQGQVVEFWRIKRRLPTTLNELQDSISGYVPPVDPTTGTAYEYLLDDTLAFRLCATFVTDSKETTSKSYPITPPYPYDSGGVREANWDHIANRTCFSRTIDPERYPPATPGLPGGLGRPEPPLYKGTN